MRILIAVLSLICLATVGVYPASSWPVLRPRMKVVNQISPASSYLGIVLGDIDTDRARVIQFNREQGVEVIRVQNESPADRAGIKVGDVLLSYNGETILSAQQVGRLVAETPQGRKVKLRLWRQGKDQNVTVITGSIRFRDADASEESPFGFSGPPSFSVFDTPGTLLIWRNGLLGVVCEPVTSQLANYFGVDHGALVREVAKGSAADKAGIKAGDVLTSIDGKDLTDPRDLSVYMRAYHHKGKPVLIVLIRERKQHKVTLSTSENPS